MSRSKRDILDTEAMLVCLTALLREHQAEDTQVRDDAESLRRISMTLHRWHELECGNDSGAIERCEETGKPFWRPSGGGRGYGLREMYPTPDCETGALKRLAKIMARYPSLTSYVQTDPRGCALYILKPGDVPEGADVSSYYSRGLAVFQ